MSLVESLGLQFYQFMTSLNLKSTRERISTDTNFIVVFYFYQGSNTNETYFIICLSK